MLDPQISNIGLPKWPALLVTGQSVSKDLAAEIIIRTDRNFPNLAGSCNEQEVCEELSGIFKIPRIPDMFEQEKFKTEDERQAWFDNHYDQLDKLQKAYRILDLQYLHNSRISSCWYGGVHGWCNWDGTIGTANYNIGKWPNVEDVANDLICIAKAFPTLQMSVQLLNHECCCQHTDKPNGPVVLFRVSGGEVSMEEQRLTDPLIATEQEVVFTNICANEIGITPAELCQTVCDIYGTNFPTYKTIG